MVSGVVVLRLILTATTSRVNPMTESNAMKVIAALLVTGVAWTMGGVSTLKANDSAQEVHIQHSIEVDRSLQTTLSTHGERLARVESDAVGIQATLLTLVKNQDRILLKLENK